MEAVDGKADQRNRSEGTRGLHRHYTRQSESARPWVRKTINQPFHLPGRIIGIAQKFGTQIFKPIDIGKPNASRSPYPQKIFANGLPVDSKRHRAKSRET
jgi:hypothetical protein